MSEDLDEEITSINSIYGDETLQQISDEPRILSLTFPSQPAISLRVEFTPDYPDVPPSVLGTQTVGSDASKGDGTYLVELVRDVLTKVYTPGAPCIFDLVEEVNSRLEQLGVAQNEQTQHAQQPAGIEEQMRFEDGQQLPPLGDQPLWAISEVVTEKKSVFVARCACVTSVEQAKQYLAHLIYHDKKVAKATHNITAHRIRGSNGIQYQDCDDDGESAAGGRVLHLLELMRVWNAIVVVTRWYGGVHLGPDRFRIINQVARDAVIKAGVVKEDGKEGSKKKAKS